VSRSASAAASSAAVRAASSTSAATSSSSRTCAVSRAPAAAPVLRLRQPAQEQHREQREGQAAEQHHGRGGHIGTLVSISVDR
jgi:hypothetical protein